MGLFGFLPAIGSIVSAFGGGGRSQPAQTQSMSGWQSLPQEVKQAYLKNYLPNVINLFNAQPNEYQAKVQEAYGGGIEGLSNQLPAYLDIFKNNVTDPTLDEIQRQADIQKNRLNAQAATNGLGGLFNSNLGVQMSEMQGNTDRLKAQYLHNMNRQNLNSAFDLRNQMLGELSSAGDQGYNQLSRLAGLLGAFPGGSSSTSVGPTAPRANTWDKIGGALTAASGLYNQYQQYQDTPWLYGGGGLR